MQYQKQQVDPVDNVSGRTSKKCSENRCWLTTCMHGNSNKYLHVTPAPYEHAQPDVRRSSRGLLCFPHRIQYLRVETVSLRPPSTCLVRYSHRLQCCSSKTGSNCHSPGRMWSIVIRFKSVGIRQYFCI